MENLSKEEVLKQISEVVHRLDPRLDPYTLLESVRGILYSASESSEFPLGGGY